MILSSNSCWRSLFTLAVKSERQQELEDKIKNFNDTKKKAKDTILKNIAHYRSALDSLTSQLDKFEDVSNKNLKKLKDDLKSIQQSDTTPVKSNKTKKIK